MTYTATPRQQAEAARFDTIRAVLPQNVRLIVGGGYRGHEGKCLRLSYRQDERGNRNGYTASLEVIIRENGKTTVHSSTDTRVVRSEEVMIASELNKLGQPGAICTLVDVESAKKAAEHLLSIKTLDKTITL